MDGGAEVHLISKIFYVFLFFFFFFFFVFLVLSSKDGVREDICFIFSRIFCLLLLS